MSSYLDTKTITIDELRKRINYPCALMFVGKKYAGKTNLIRNVIKKKDFNNIFVVSLTAHKGNYDGLVEYPENIMTECNDDFLKNLLEWQTEHPKAQTLIIFDDFITGEGCLRRIPSIHTLGTSGRNFNISVVISSQSLKFIPAAIRENVELCFFGRQKQGSIEKVVDEFADSMKPKKVLKQELLYLTDSGRKDWLVQDDKNNDWRLIKQEDIEIIIKR